MQSPKNPQKYDEIVWEIVWQIPMGQVFSYGQIASMIPPPESIDPPSYARVAPRWVGYAMSRAMQSALNVEAGEQGESIPWHRVINSQGGISLAADTRSGAIQRARLTAEGVKFNEQGFISFQVYGWDGPSTEWREARNLLPPRSMKFTDTPPEDSSQKRLF